MNFSLAYLAGRFVYRISDFFHHWYTDASRVFFHKFVSFLERVDRTVALRVTLKFFFQPLYKDYTVIGRILGVVFRTGRLIVGVAVYALISAIFIFIYVLWLAVPVILILYVLGAR
ncbi:MAG: hypothetical protein HY432_01880 [Candidatus Liptonbacteria bacterium]|nr:hypothetical protein [Candidatus Liptonbacteria bacterium]